MTNKKTTEPSVEDMDAYRLLSEINRCALEGAIRVLPTNSPDEVLSAAEKFAAFIRGDKAETKEENTDGK